MSHSLQDIEVFINTELAVNQVLSEESLEAQNISVHVKRLDLIHPQVNGNKWFKLKYNLEKASTSEHKTLLTFGGAFSNHIFSTASAGKIFGLKTIGIIRGEKPANWSPTLLHAKKCGMQLEFITRLTYAEKETEDFNGWLHEEYGSFHLVPEGGSNYLGVNGCMEILTEADKKNYDIICCACGTGATLAGLLLSASPKQKIIGFPVFKNGEFLKQEVIKHLKYFLMNEEIANEFQSQFSLITDYHFGGYAKWNDELLQFIRDFENQHKIPLDQVYTGKMMFGVLDLARKKHFAPETRILIIHTGGLQGRTTDLDL